MAALWSGVRGWKITASAGAALAIGVVARAGNVYDCTVNSPISTLNYTISATAPVAGSFKGADTTIAPPGLQTRTKTPPQNFITCGIIAGENDDVAFTGTGAVSGNGSNFHPTGSFRIGFDTAANTAFVLSASFQLLGASTGTATSSINNFSASAFCAVNPPCQIPVSLTFNLPLGNAQITAVQAVQSGGVANGTLTPVSPDIWDYSIPANLDVTPAVVFNGAPLDTGTSTIPVVLTGRITRTGSAVSVTSSFNINSHQVNTTPVPIAQAPISVANAPLCNGMNLLLSGNITSSTLDFMSTSALTSNGAHVPCPCDSDGNDQIDPDDLFIFLDRWFVQTGTSGPGLSADINHSNAVDPDDLFIFLDCWFGRNGLIGC